MLLSQPPYHLTSSDRLVLCVTVLLAPETDSEYVPTCVPVGRDVVLVLQLPPPQAVHIKTRNITEAKPIVTRRLRKARLASAARASSHISRCSIG